VIKGRRRRRRRRRKVYSKLTQEEGGGRIMKEEEGESLFKADAVKEEDPERDRATQVGEGAEQPSSQKVVNWQAASAWWSRVKDTRDA
jgi:hypothetical protein